MEFKSFALIFVLLNTVYGVPTESADFDDYNIQNDNDNYGGNYEDTDDTVEDSKMPEEPLKISSPGEEFIRNLGDSVVLPCKIEGSSNNYVQIWRKKNKDKKDAILFQTSVKMAATPNMNLSSNGSLVITNLHIQDAGIYECTAMDTQQNSPSVEHKVVLRTPPQITSLTVKDNITLLRNGDTLILKCKVTGYPEPVISWHRGSYRFDVQGEDLIIENVKHHDSGTYKCLADNKIGEPAFNYINIKVEYKPVITVEKVTVSSESSLETELECNVHAEPKAVVVWIKDGLNVVNSERHQLISNEHKHNLILKDIRDSDFGVYTCSATNSLGTTKKDIVLVPTPAIYRFMKSQSQAKEVTLTWEVQSKSNLTEHELLYRTKGESGWKKAQDEVKHEVIKSGNDVYNVKYTFDRGLNPGEYEVKLRSKNRKGWSEYSEVIKVEVFAKHGQHKAHKKGHKQAKERQLTPTTTQTAEHQEGDFIKESASSDNESSSSSILIPRLLLCLILCTFLQFRLSLRI